MDKKGFEELRARFNLACNSYVIELLKSWDIDNNECFWVSNEVGGTYMINDTLALNMDEIIYVVENNISFNECLEWIDYNMKCHEYSFNTMCLRAFHQGAPRVPQETFDTLDKMKADLDDAIKHAKEQF